MLGFLESCCCFIELLYGYMCTEGWSSSAFFGVNGMSIRRDRNHSTGWLRSAILTNRFSCSGGRGSFAFSGSIKKIKSNIVMNTFSFIRFLSEDQWLLTSIRIYVKRKIVNFPTCYEGLSPNYENFYGNLWIRSRILPLISGSSLSSSFADFGAFLQRAAQEMAVRSATRSDVF